MQRALASVATARQPEAPRVQRMKQHFRFVLGLALAAVLLGLFLRHADLHRVWQETLRADWRLIALACANTLLLYILRAIRWGRLLGPIGRAGFRNLFETTVMGFMASAVLPGRVGEVIRPYLLGRREGLSASAGFATIVLERVLDLLAVLGLFAVYLIFFTSSVPSSATALRGLAIGSAIVAAATLAGCGVLFALARDPDRTVGFAARFLRWCPRRVADAGLGLLHSFTRGLAILRDRRALVVAGVYSVVIWLTIAGGFWLIIEAFHLALPWNAPLLLLPILTVGVAVPTPGAIGAFHEAFRIGATTFFGAAPEPAVGAAIVLHAVSFGPVILLGAWYFIREGIGVTRIRALAEDETRRATSDALRAAAADSSRGCTVPVKGVSA